MLNNIITMDNIDILNKENGIKYQNRHHPDKQVLVYKIESILKVPSNITRPVEYKLHLESGDIFHISEFTYNTFNPRVEGYLVVSDGSFVFMTRDELDQDYYPAEVSPEITDDYLGDMSRDFPNDIIPVQWFGTVNDMAATKYAIDRNYSVYHVMEWAPNGIRKRMYVKDHHPINITLIGSHLYIDLRQFTMFIIGEGGSAYIATTRGFEAAFSDHGPIYTPPVEEKEPEMEPDPKILQLENYCNELNEIFDMDFTYQDEHDAVDCYRYRRMYELLVNKIKELR